MSWYTSPWRMKPLSILPMTMVPMSRHLSTMGRRTGASGLGSVASMPSRICSARSRCKQGGQLQTGWAACGCESGGHGSASCATSLPSLPPPVTHIEQALAVIPRAQLLGRRLLDVVAVQGRDGQEVDLRGCMACRASRQAMLEAPRPKVLACRELWATCYKWQGRRCTPPPSSGCSRSLSRTASSSPQWCCTALGPTTLHVQSKQRPSIRHRHPSSVIASRRSASKHPNPSLPSPPSRTQHGRRTIWQRHRWAVQLVDHEDEARHAQRLGKLRVLARLPAALKPRLKLALLRGQQVQQCAGAHEQPCDCACAHRLQGRMPPAAERALGAAPCAPR